MCLKVNVNHKEAAQFADKIFKLFARSKGEQTKVYFKTSRLSLALIWKLSLVVDFEAYGSRWMEWPVHQLQRSGPGH